MLTKCEVFVAQGETTMGISVRKGHLLLFALQLLFEIRS